MADENYPDPDCDFGVAIQRDLIQIKDVLQQILDKQEEHTDTLQNGLTTKVANIQDKVEELEEKREQDQKEEEEKQAREDRRDWEFKKMLIGTVLGNLLALGVGLIIGWVGFT